MKSTVRIGSLVYKIGFVKNLELRGTPIDGLHLAASCEIQIRYDLGPQARRQTLWHEIVHSLIYQDQMGHVKLKKERAVDRLAWGIMAVLKDNPWLAKLP